MKKVLSMMLACMMLLSLATGCIRQEGGSGTNAAGKVYYLNFKPEQDAAWQQLANVYKQKTGVEVKVVTAASGKYEETLRTEIDKENAPTLFQISGTVGYEGWKEYCLDLSNTDVYKELTSDDWAVKVNGKVYGIAYVYEGYGIIVNKKLLADAGYSIDDIRSFSELKSVAEDIHTRKNELGFDAFTSNTLDGDSSWRFSGHLANLPLYYEFAADGVKSQPATIKGTYLPQFKAVWDLYTQNSTVEPQKITSAVNAAEEFAAGKGVFYQNGTWAYNDIKAIGDDNIGYLPIYFGVDDAKQGLCCGTENYWAVNSQASEADRKATLDFLKWLVTSEEGTKALAQDMGFVSPFKSAKPVENVLCNIMNDYTKEGCYNVSWAFNYTPNVDAWRKDLVSALADYTASGGSWDAVKTAFVDGWKTQYEASKS